MGGRLRPEKRELVLEKRPMTPELRDSSDPKSDAIGERGGERPEQPWEAIVKPVGVQPSPIWQLGSLVTAEQSDLLPIP
eukprot:916056-Pleurochrysis_carterae.AAC.1